MKIFLENYLYNLATDRYRGILAGTLKIFLFILSLIYNATVRVLILANSMRPYRLKCKVISVGNITLGGTGKTSLVALISKYLRGQGHKVAVLSRGYKRKIKQSLDNQALNFKTMGDEPYMLLKALGDIPVLVDANRIRAAQVAMRNYNADTLVLDDAFQQWAIAKDLEIVTIDATKPFGNRHLIPRGILREPLSSLKRADVFVLTKTNIGSHLQEMRNFLSSLNPNAAIFESVHESAGVYRLGKPDEPVSLEGLRTKTVTLLSGIASPESFESLIRQMNIKVGLTFIFPDHYEYSQKDLDRIITESKNKNIDTVITTEKDAVRLQGLWRSDSRLVLAVLRVGLKIKDEQGFFNRLLGVYTG